MNSRGRGYHTDMVGRNSWAVPACTNGDRSASTAPIADFVVHVQSGNPHTISHVRRSLADWLTTCPMPADRAGDVVLACYEAMANVIEHAYSADQSHEFELQACCLDGSIAVKISDHGSWRLPSRSDQDRGRGLPLLSALCDRADIHLERKGATVALEWDLASSRS